MKTISFLVLIQLFHYTGFAQTISDEKVKEVAASYCNCMTPAVKKLHPQLILLTENIEKKGEKESEKELMEWLAKADSTQQAALMEGLTYMQTSFLDSIQHCTETMQKKYPEFENGKETAVLINRFSKALQESGTCKVIAAFFAIGNKKEEIAQ